MSFSMSREAYYFFMELFEKSVNNFFEDPLGFADGEPLDVVFNRLKEIGEELEIEIETLAKYGDMEQLSRLMYQEDIYEEEDKEIDINVGEWVSWDNI